MRKLIPVFFFLLIAVLHANAQQDTALIKACFAGYKNAILTDKGQEALAFVDSRTVKYYSDILQKTKTLDSAGIDKLSILDKLTILMVRHRATREEIMRLDGRSLLVYAIERGMVGKGSVQQLSIGEVLVRGNAAEGQVVVGTAPTSLAYNFYKENGTWKMDITSVLPEGNNAMKKIIKDSERPENEFLLMLIENATDKEPSKDIWKPLLN
jgi:hypothetical protein